MIRFIFLFYLFFCNTISISEANIKIKTIHNINLKKIYHLNKYNTVKNINIKKNLLNKIHDTNLKLSSKNILNNTIKTNLNNNNSLFILENDPIISNISCFGNHEINKHTILNQCKFLGFKVHSMLNKKLINQLQNNLKNIYNNIGLYDAKINIDYEFIKYNSVILKINIFEGNYRILQDIHIFGNKLFSKNFIISLFQSYPNYFQRKIFNNNTYDNDIFQMDLKKLKHFYYENGYVNFKIKKVNFVLSKNKRDLSINIIIDEGHQYNISSIIFHGDFENYTNKIYDQLSNIKIHDKYNLYDIQNFKNKLKIYFLNHGFLKFNINTCSILNKKNKSIILHIYINLGPRFTVNKIEIKGNKFTKDKILNNFIKDISLGSYVNLPLLKQIKCDIENSGYIRNVVVDINPSKHFSDKIDIIYKIKEKKLNDINTDVGYNIFNGININLKLQHNNYLGYGIQTIVNTFHNNDENSIDLSLKYPNIFKNVTLNNRIFYHLEKSKDNKFYYLMNQNYGSETGLKFQNFKNHIMNVSLNYNKENFLHLGNSFFSWKDFRFIKMNNNNNNQVILNKNNSNTIILYSWLYNTLPNVNFPKSGSSVSVEGKLFFNKYFKNFHKEVFSLENYSSIFKNLGCTLKTRIHVGIESSLNINDIPNYERFYMEGENNIRGFINNSIKPEISCVDKNDNVNDNTSNLVKLNHKIGGNSFIISKIDLIIPNLFILKNYNNFLQTSLFFDCGNIWNVHWNDSIYNVFHNIKNINIINNVRASTGIETIIMSPIGPLKFSYSYPILYELTDLLKNFQFNIYNN